MTFNRDPVGVCYGDSGAPTLFNGRVVAVASDGALDCVFADNRARVDSKDVRKWIKGTDRSSAFRFDLLARRRALTVIVAPLNGLIRSL